MQPGSTINYTVTVGNTGDVAITNAPVTDNLPPHVTVKAGTISDGGVLANGVITWHVTLAPGATHTFTYAVTVDADAPQGGELLNRARFLDLQDTTTHVVPSGALALVKEVSPVAGHGVVGELRGQADLQAHRERDRSAGPAGRGRQRLPARSGPGAPAVR